MVVARGAVWLAASNDAQGVQPNVYTQELKKKEILKIYISYIDGDLNGDNL